VDDLHTLNNLLEEFLLLQTERSQVTGAISNFGFSLLAVELMPTPVGKLGPIHEKIR